MQVQTLTRPGLFGLSHQKMDVVKLSLRSQTDDRMSYGRTIHPLNYRKFSGSGGSQAIPNHHTTPTVIKKTNRLFRKMMVVKLWGSGTFMHDKYRIHTSLDTSILSFFKGTGTSFIWLWCYSQIQTLTLTGRSNKHSVLWFSDCSGWPLNYFLLRCRRQLRVAQVSLVLPVAQCENQCVCRTLFKESCHQNCGQQQTQTGYKYNLPEPLFKAVLIKASIGSSK